MCPDLNPIENTLNLLKAAVENSPVLIGTTPKLKSALKKNEALCPTNQMFGGLRIENFPTMNR